MIEHISAIVADSIEVKRRYFAEHAAEVVRAAEIIAASFRAGGKVLLCGNGGSSTDAQHIAGEFVNQFSRTVRRALPALALSTDGGVITSIANDTGFEQVFARQVEAFGAQGDVLVAITTSGTSANIVAPLCDLALIVESPDTQRIQETHNLVGHILCELVERMLFAAREG
jgi:D-sedoheptulose 7-phosphate isomerase